MIEGPHFVGDLRLTELLITEGRCITTAPLTDAVRSVAGGASLGVVATMFDVGASHPAVIAGRPDWTATQDLALHGTGQPVIEGPIVVDSQLVRAGKKVVAVAGSVYDGAGEEDLAALREAIDGGDGSDGGRGLTLAASGLITFARISRSAAPGMDTYDPATWVGQVRRVLSARPDAGSLSARLGLRVIDAPGGRLELERTPYVINSIGTIQGGAQAVLIEAAAEVMRPPMVAVDMQIHYLSQLDAGPVRTSGRVLREASDHAVVTVKVEDAGSGDRLLSQATVTLWAPPAPRGLG